MVTVTRHDGRIVIPDTPAQKAAFDIDPQGTVLILCTDGQLRPVHPAVVIAFAKRQIPPDAWALACQRAGYSLED